MPHTIDIPFQARLFPHKLALCGTKLDRIFSAPYKHVFAINLLIINYACAATRCQRHARSFFSAYCVERAKHSPTRV